IHDNDPDPKLLAYQYLQTLPQLAQGPGNTVWMVPSELTSALKMLSSAFDSGGATENGQGPTAALPRVRRAEVPQPSGPAAVEAQGNGTSPAAAAGAIVNGADPAPASAGATAANAEANPASAGTAGAVAAADAELAAAEREAADDARQVGGADGQ
ncbi:MAG TPA: hypothetical protein VMC83_25325, partial [Streptosporangiaceae bacterium]|nr:hypothetical protein [Streptosporangiaceae bacterium]